MFQTAMFLELLEMIRDNCYANSKAHGFWDEAWNLGEKIALIHSELSEALEAHRSKLPTMFLHNDIQYHWQDGQVKMTPQRDKEMKLLSKPEGLAIELADAIIRIMDLCGKLDIDIGRAILTKMEYNSTRSHKHGRNY